MCVVKQIQTSVGIIFVVLAIVQLQNNYKPHCYEICFGYLWSPENESESFWWLHDLSHSATDNPKFPIDQRSKDQISIQFCFSINGRQWINVNFFDLSASVQRNHKNLMERPAGNELFIIMLPKPPLLSLDIVMAAIDPPSSSSSPQIFALASYCCFKKPWMV